MSHFIFIGRLIDWKALDLVLKAIRRLDRDLPVSLEIVGDVDRLDSGIHGQYARRLAHWVASIGLEPKLFGTHSLRRTKATLIYRRTGNLRAVQYLLGHTKIESTVRYPRSGGKMSLAGRWMR